MCLSHCHNVSSLLVSLKSRTPRYVRQGSLPRKLNREARRTSIFDFGANPPLGFNRRDFLAISSEKLANVVYKARLDEDLLLDGVELFGFLASHSLITFCDSKLLSDRHYRGCKLVDFIFHDIDVRCYNVTFWVLFSTLMRITSRMSESSWPESPRIFMIVLQESASKFSNSSIVTAGNFETDSLSLFLSLITPRSMMPSYSFRVRHSSRRQPKGEGSGS
jgi:hypothetical protein